MHDFRNYHEGDRVEVFVHPRDEWVRAHVLECRERADGRAEYFVQLAGYPTLDPAWWFVVDNIRPR